MSLITDILLPTYLRPFLLEQTLRDLTLNTPQGSYRLFVIVNSIDPETQKVLKGYREFLTGVRYNTENVLTSEALNQAFALSELLVPLEGLPPFVTIIEDDVHLVKGWLETCTAAWEDFNDLQLAILSGYHSPLHPKLTTYVRNNITLHVKQTAVNLHLFAPRDFWRDIRPLKSNDPAGYIIKHANKSVQKLNRFIGVLPGLAIHTGAWQSTKQRFNIEYRDPWTEEIVVIKTEV